MPDRDATRERVLHMMRHYREMKDRLKYLKEKLTGKKNIDLIEKGPQSDNPQLHTVSEYQNTARPSCRPSS